MLGSIGCMLATWSSCFRQSVTMNLISTGDIEAMCPPTVKSYVYDCSEEDGRHAEVLRPIRMVSPIAGPRLPPVAAPAAHACSAAEAGAPAKPQRACKRSLPAHWRKMERGAVADTKDLDYSASDDEDQVHIGLQSSGPASCTLMTCHCGYNCIRSPPLQMLLGDLPGRHYESSLPNA